MARRRRRRKKNNDKAEAYALLGILLAVIVAGSLPAWTSSLGELMPTMIKYAILLTLAGVVFGSVYRLVVYLRKRNEKRIQEERYGKIDKIDEFAHMSGIEFEKYIAWYYEMKGYKTSTTADSGDHGIDVLIEKEGEQIPVQTKRYKRGNNVGEPEIRNFVGSIRKYDRGIFITTSNFTKAAYDYADTECPELELINGKKLMEMVHNI